MPTDIGPGTLLYRKDILERAGVGEDELTRSWDSYVAAGVRIKAKTGAYLIGTVQSIKDILIRSGIQPGEGQYFDKDSNKTHHGSICQAAKQGSVTGTVTTADDGKKKIIAVKSLKFD